MATTTPERRTVIRTKTAVCMCGCFEDYAIDGPAEQIKHECGEWTWADGNYCVMCGKKLEKEDVQANQERAGRRQDRQA